MTEWPATDFTIIRQHLRDLRLRPASVRTYQTALVEFQRFVLKHSPDQCVSRTVVEQWLRHWSALSSTPTIMQRLWPINRFLNWLADRRLIASNPFEELRKDLGTRDTARIIRALLTSDSAAALEVLRPVPRFGSELGPVMRDYLLLKRSLGFRYRTQELQLLRLDRFLQERADLAARPVSEIVEEWAKRNPTPNHLMECVLTGKMLAQALQRIDPAVTAPRMDRRLNQQIRLTQRRPYIYSESEVALLLKTALSFPAPRARSRPRMLYTMIVLAYCAGLRFGEIVRLRVGDVDLASQTIEIHETKFFKSRRLPVTGSVTTALADYLQARRVDGAPSDSAAPLFWHARAAREYRYPTIHALLVQVIRRAGLKPHPGTVGPRIHDLRHAFVVNRILAWYREGLDPQGRLPYLVTYLGHKDLHSTLVYITITRELLQQANDRFRAFGAHVIQARSGGALCE
jgi:site-specific recombinase XerD